MRIFLISLFLAYSFIGKAQDKQNVFIQSNPSQLFFVEFNGYSFSSNADGFVLLPTTDSVYSLIISFPNQSITQFKFNVEDKKLNGGFFLEKSSNNSWQLIDLYYQTKIIGVKIDNQVKIENEPTNLAIDIFSTQLANAVNDQDIRDFSYIIKLEKSQAQTTNKQSIVKSNTTSTVSEIKLIYQDVNKMVFVDQNKKQIDTVTITFEKTDAKIDLPTSISDSTSNKSVAIVEEILNIGSDTLKVKEVDVKLNSDSIYQTLIIPDKQQDSSKLNLDSLINASSPSIIAADSVNIEELKVDKQINTKDTTVKVESTQLVDSKIKFGKQIEVDSKDVSNRKDASIDIQKPNNVLSKDTIVKSKNVIKVGCKVVAEERDLILFRRKMILMNNQTELLFFASKEFKQKCYSTLYIRNLSFIFLNDKEKLQFLKLAYTNVLDPENFGSLERFLTDEQEILNFRNLINKQ